MKKIAFEFYRNPFRDEENEHKSADIDDTEFEDEDYLGAVRTKRKPFPILMTSFGIIPLTEDLMSNKTFKLWIGHTNFSISMSDANKLAEVPGVEAVKFFSRYRFLVCIGKLFNTSDVKLNIQHVLCDDNLEELKEQPNIELDKKTKDKVNQLILELENKEHYIIYVLPNGKIIYYFSDIYNDEFNKKVMLITTTFRLVGGSLFGS